MDQMQFRDVFNVVFQVPEVKPGDEVRTGTTIDIGSLLARYSV